MSHTPGPWYSHFAACIEEQGTGDYVDATGICTASEEEFMQDGGRGDLVAFVPHDGPHQANACLIAAAPDLLEALRACLAVLHPDTTEHDIALGAIATATGATQ